MKPIIHFIKGWDNFNIDLYTKVLIAKLKQLDSDKLITNQTVKNSKKSFIFANENAI